jgi:hypothetical protein
MEALPLLAPALRVRPALHEAARVATFDQRETES